MGKTTTESKKVKILYIITLAEMGGAQRYIYDLATSEQAITYDITVAYGQGPSADLAQKLKHQNINTIQLQKLIRPISPLNDLSAILELKKLYRTLAPDIIHLNSSKAGIIGSLASFLYSPLKPAPYALIYTVHGWVFNEPMSNFKKSLFIFLEKFTAKFKNKIICVSEFDRQIALKEKIASQNKLLTIHNGVNADNLTLLERKEAKESLELPDDDKPLIGTIANFYDTKGLTYLIETANILINHAHLPVNFAIIGDGELRPQLENMIGNYNLKNHFYLLGSKNQASRYLKIFDVYVCSSVKEGLPYSLIEALLAELPTVSTNVGGIPEIIEDGKTGLLVDPKNPQKLASGIKSLLENKKYGKMLGKNGKESMMEHFSQQQMIAQTLDQYQK